MTGHFWEGRCRAQRLLDEASVLACTAYVDLNPIRAALAEDLLSSQFTDAKDRIDDLRDRGTPTRLSNHEWERSRHCHCSGWMSPIEFRETVDPVGINSNTSPRRGESKVPDTFSLLVSLGTRCDQQKPENDVVWPVASRIPLYRHW